MSLNPNITKDAMGVYHLNWTPDPTAEGYAFTTPSGSSRSFNPKLARTKLGSGLGEPVVASVAPLDVTARPAETATFPPPAPPPASAATGWGKSYSGSSKPVPSDDVYDQVMAQSGAIYGGAPAFSHAHLLSYMNASSCKQVDNEWNTGIPHSMAAANGWLLKDSSGALLFNKSYPDSHILDVGNPAAQQTWAKNVGDFLAATGCKGVFIDDVCADYHMTANGTSPKYDQKSWEDAMVGFLAAVGPPLKAAGFDVVLNAGSYIAGNGGSDDGSLTKGFWQRIGSTCTHLFNEYFHSLHGLSMGSGWNQHWDLWQALVPLAQSLGCHFVGGAASNPAFVYGSFLLDWDGKFGGCVWGAPQVSVGAPLAAKSAVGSCWKRAYERATVYVNPTAGSQVADGRTLAPAAAVFA